MFCIVASLLSRGPVDQEEPVEAPAGLEVDFEAGERLPDEATDYGHDVVLRYPARRPGWTGWLVRRTWTPAWGYSAQGVEDSLVDSIDLGRLDAAYAAVERARTIDLDAVLAAERAERDLYIAFGATLAPGQVVDIDPGCGRFTVEALASEPLLRAVLWLTEARRQECERTGRAETIHSAYQRACALWRERLEATGGDGRWGRAQ